MSGKDSMPGLDAIGCGYQIAYGEYASIDSCGSQLFDFDKIGTKEIHSAATGKTYSFPAKFVQYLDNNVRKSSVITGETVEDFLEKLTASVQAEASYNAFSGSIKSEFSNSSEINRFEAYTRLQYNATLYELNLDETAGNHRDFLKSVVLDDIDKLNPNELFNKYGTHYVQSIQVGGRCTYSAVTNTLKTTKKFSLSVCVEAKFNGEVAKASTKDSVTDTSDYKKVTTNSRFMTKLIGGNVSAFGTDKDPKLEEWAKTVRDFPMMIDFNGHNGLVPLWKLAATAERREALEKATDIYIENHKTDFGLDKGPVLEGKWVPARVQFTDIGSHAFKYFTVYKPNVDNGWFWLGQRGYGPDEPGEKKFEILLVREKSWAQGVLCNIEKYEQIWNDKGSHNGHDYSIWRPIPEDPEKFRSLGSFFRSSKDEDDLKPKQSETENLMAVHSEFTVPANLGNLLWKDEGSHASNDASCWEINHVDNDGQEAGGLWIGNNSWDAPNGTDVFCLKKSAIEFV